MRVAIAAGLAAILCAGAAQAQLRPFAIVDDAIPQSLTGAPGDPVRGRAIVASRQVGLCLLCHSGPFPEERFQGDLAPSLAGGAPLGAFLDLPAGERVLTLSALSPTSAGLAPMR